MGYPRLNLAQQMQIGQALQTLAAEGRTGMGFTALANIVSKRVGFQVKPDPVRLIANALGLNEEFRKVAMRQRHSETCTSRTVQLDETMERVDKLAKTCKLLMERVVALERRLDSYDLD